jgi:hypothetical protein
MVTSGVAMPCSCESERAVGHVLVLDAGPSAGWVLLSSSRGYAWLAVLGRRSLDTRLAAGELPESSRLLAVRSEQITRRENRHRIARRWDALAAEAHRRLSPAHADVAEHIQDVAEVLRANQPLRARGVALAITMLRATADAIRRSSVGGHDLAAAAARSAIAAM